MVLAALPLLLPLVVWFEGGKDAVQAMWDFPSQIKQARTIDRQMIDRVHKQAEEENNDV